MTGTVFRPATTGVIANILLAVYSSQSLSIVATTPPKRSESWQKSAEQEGKIFSAIQNIQKSNIKSLCAAATLYKKPLSTLHDRVSDIFSRVDKYHHRQKLTQFEEDLFTE
ncbi:hypothetical protein VI817_009979 [Penicillium citrinum]|nr:hypothetical protein VI817_009979 [Penicillium citrinum]